MPAVYNISEAQARQILGIEENFLNDVKAKEIRPSKLSETVSAFANAVGGDIYIGVSEIGKLKLRRWLGFADIEEANEIIHVLTQAHELGNHLYFEFLECEKMEGYLLHIVIKKVKSIVKSSKGEVFVRSNAGKIKITDDTGLRRLRLDKGIVTFENEWINVRLEQIENSLSIINFMLNVIPHSEPRNYLQNQDLLRDDQVRLSGVLLFCDEPAVYLAKRCSVKIMRYKTKEEDIGREFLDGVPITIEGDLYNVIEQAVRRTKELVESIQKLGEGGLEAVQYPHETLHEIITNAILHRDYSIVADVQVRIFDNRIEVQSPGKLPGHVTANNILDTQSARNPTVVRLINKFPDPPNQDVGEGLNTAFRAMEDLRLRPPQIIEGEDHVLVVIPHEPLASAEEIVMDYLKTHEEVNNRTARELTGIKSENTMKNVFLRLKDRGILEPIPDRKGSRSAWRLASQGSN